MAVISFLDTLFRRRKKKYADFISSLEYDIDNIRAATNEFSDLIGHGLCGSVYKGKLQTGQEIVVKITRNYGEFLNEINLLPKLRHTSLIHLLGFCSEQDHYFIVYESMPNSSLDHFIFDRNIVMGIARGLRYLHEESGLHVVHLDIKPRNILLDENFQPKIMGFKMARLIQDGESEAESTRLSGTFGYLDPHFCQTFRFSAKSDVYAFGVTILTIITRRINNYGWEEENLIQYALRCWTRGEAINVIDEVMRKEDSISEILRQGRVLMKFCIGLVVSLLLYLNQEYLNQEFVISLLKRKKQIGYCRHLPDMALLCHPCLHIRET